MEPNPVRIEELLAHAGWVRKLAARLVRDAGAAEDVTQEVWAYALRSPPSDRRNLRGWLTAVVQNAARSFGRSESRRAARDTRAVRSATEESTAELVERGQLHRRLVEQVMALEEPYRSIVLAHWFEGESIPEIARRQGLTPKMARTRLDSAHTQLRKHLDESSGGRDAWSIAFVRWMGPRQVAVTGAGIGGIVLGKKVVVAGIAAVLLWIGWFAWSRAPVQLSGEKPLAQSTPQSPEAARAVVAPMPPESRRSISRIFVVDECAHPLAGARVTASSSAGERALGVTDEQGVLVVAPEDAAGPASVSHDGFESAQISDLKSERSIHVALLDTNAITGRVRCDVAGFHPESMTVVALESSQPDVEIETKRLSHAAGRSTPRADGSFRLACLPPNREYTILAGGSGWVSTIPMLQAFPRVACGARDLELHATRLFAARLEFRDQDGEPAHVFAPGYASGSMKNLSTQSQTVPVEFLSAEYVLAGLPEAWMVPTAGAHTFLFTSDWLGDQIGPNRLELGAVGYDPLTFDYFAGTTAKPIETQSVLLHRSVKSFGTLRVRFMADASRPAAPDDCPEGKLRAVPESGEPLEFGITGSLASLDVVNLPVGQYRFSFLLRMDGGKSPEAEPQAPRVDIRPGELSELLVPVGAFSSVRLTLLDKSDAPYAGQFVYSLKPAKRDPVTGRVSASGPSDIRICLEPPQELKGLRAGTYILSCVSPPPAKGSPEAGPRDVVFDLQPGEEKSLTVRLKTP